MAEIKISELSIGDWVRADGEAKRVHSIEYQNGEYFVHFSDPDTNSEDYMHAPFIKPIPLTPEILEKNGLCVVEEDADFSEYELFGSENFSIFHIKGTFHHRLETPQASVVCWNVHQLQNALRLAGVGKEIEV